MTKEEFEDEVQGALLVIGILIICLGALIVGVLIELWQTFATPR
jgi:hypothetical protein